MEKIHMYIYMCVCVLSHFSCARLCATLWTAACQASLSMGFSGQEHWCRLPYLLTGDLPNPGVEPMSLASTCIGKRVLYH